MRTYSDKRQCTKCDEINSVIQKLQNALQVKFDLKFTFYRSEMF